MKQARYYFKKGRAKPHEIRYYDTDGKIHSLFFTEKTDADNFKDECNSTAVLPVQIQFDVEERMIFSRIKNACIAAGAPLSKAAELVENGIEAFSIVKTVSYEDAQKSFLDDCMRRRVREYTKAFYKRYIKSFRKSAGKDSMADIKKSDAKAYLLAEASPEHAKRALRPFFNYCIGMKWVAENPFKEIKPSKVISRKKLPHVLTVKEAKTVLDKVDEAWRPMFALLLFAGVRPGELTSPKLPLDPDPADAPADASGDGKVKKRKFAEKPTLQIKHVDFARKRIVIPYDVAKTHEREIVGAPAVLWKWMEPLKNRDKNEYIAPASYDIYRKQKKLSGVNISHDSTRHSFASYGYHFLGAELTVEIMGHERGFDTFKKHYKGRATPAEAKKYFAISPPEDNLKCRPKAKLV